MSINMKYQTVCFTGHRNIRKEQQKEISIKLKATLINLIKNGYYYFGCGGALGFDTLAAQKVLNLKKDFPQAKLILVLPCINQTRGWKFEDVQMYKYIKKCLDKFVYTSNNYFNGCMQKRNRHLVDSSSVCVCYLTENTGGTAYTVSYAEKQA